MARGLSQLDPSEGIGLYTDGSSWQKDRSGGWAWIAIDAFGGESHPEFGGADDTTNNRMEMTAWIKGLDAVFKAHGPSTIIVFSDSEYVGKGAMNRARKRKVNIDLWLELDDAIDRHLYVEFRHVKGHTGDEYNEIVDRLAGEARQAHKHQGV